MKVMRKAFKQWRGRPPEEIDAARKAMAEDPPGITTEGEHLAYYRGFLAGSRRTRDESERFQKYQDIAFRVAAELDAKWRGLSADRRLSYEDLVSIGYEAVLEVLRKKTEPPRAVVAQAIRRRIVDNIREVAGKQGQKIIRTMSAVMGDEGEAELAVLMPAAVDPDASRNDLWGEIEARCESAPDPRLELILKGRSEGRTLAELGVTLGVSEARVCQLVTENRGWLEEHILPLVGEVA